MERAGIRRDLVAIGLIVARHPSVWGEGIKSAFRMAKRGWWHTPPFLPLPGSSYWTFRKVTVFGGDGTGTLATDQVLGYLKWSKQMKPRR